MARADQIYLGVVLTNTDTSPTGLAAGDLVELDINSSASVKRVSSGGSSKVTGVVVTGGAQNSKVVIGGFPGQRLNINVSTSLAAAIGDKVISGAIAGLGTVDNGAPTDQIIGTVLSPKVGGVGNTIDVLFTTIAAAGGGAASGDGQVLVDGSDTTANFLASKLVAGTGITLTVQNSGGDESILFEAIQDAPHDAIYLVKTIGSSGLTNAIAADTLGGPGFLKAAADGTFSIDTNTYQGTLTASSGTNLTSKFILQGTSSAGVPNAQFLGALATGLVKNTTTTGVLSIAVANTDYADPAAYFVVTRSTSTPTNATNLGALTTGLIKSTVVAGVSTLSIDANTYLTAALAASTYQVILTSASGANLTSKFILQGVADAGITNAQFLGALATGLLKNTTTTGVLSVATANTDYADPAAYFVVTRATNAPTNATNLGALTTGLVKSTVSAGVSTISIDANTYLTTSVAAATYQPILTSASGANLTSKFVLGGTTDAGAPNAQFLGALATGVLKSTTTTGVLSIAVANTDYADPAAYFVVTRSTNAPSNATDLGTLSTGLVKSTVSSGVSTISIDTNTYLTTALAASTYLTIALAASTYQPILTSASGANLTSKFIVQGTADSGLTNAQFLGALGTGLVKNTTSTGVLSIATANTDYPDPLAYYVVTRATNKPTNATNLGLLASGYVKLVVTAGVAQLLNAPFTGDEEFVVMTTATKLFASSPQFKRNRNVTTNDYTILVGSGSTSLSAGDARLSIVSTGTQRALLTIEGYGTAGTNGARPVLQMYNDLGPGPSIKSFSVGMYSSTDTPYPNTAYLTITSAFGDTGDIHVLGFSGPMVSFIGDGKLAIWNSSAAVSASGSSALRTNTNKLQYSENGSAWANFTDLTGANANAYYLVLRATNAPTNATSLGTLASGVLQHTVSGAVSTPTALSMTAGQIPFGAATGGTLTQSSKLVWTDTGGSEKLSVTGVGPSQVFELAMQNTTVASATSSNVVRFYYGTTTLMGQVIASHTGSGINTITASVQQSASSADDLFVVSGTSAGGQAPLIVWTQNKDVALGASAQILAAGTRGFVYLPTIAGTPSGVPTLSGGLSTVDRRAIAIDEGNHRLYSYLSSAWHYASFDDGVGTIAGNSYLIVTRSTSAPANATNLGTLTTGLVKSTVASGISTISIDSTAYLSGNVGPGAGTIGGGGSIIQSITLDVNGRVTAAATTTVGSSADPLGYYVVTRATNAPANALNLGALVTGFVKVTVSGGIASISTDTSTYLTTASAASTYQPILTSASAASLTSKFIVQGTADAGLTNAQFLGALTTGIVKNTTTTGVLSIAVANTDYADPTAFYVVTKAASAPANSINLGALTTGLVKSTVSGGVSTLSIDANTYLTTSVAAATYQPILTAGSNITIVGTTISATGSGGADPLGYYVVTRATNAPTNAINLGAQTTGLVKSTVSGGIATLSIDSTAYLTGTLTNTDVLFAAGSSTIGQDAQFTWNSTTHTLTLANQVISAASSALIFSAASSVEIQKTNAGDLGIGTLGTTASFYVFTQHTQRFTIDNTGVAYFSGSVYPTTDGTQYLGVAGTAWFSFASYTVETTIVEGFAGGSNLLQIQNSSASNTYLLLESTAISVKGSIAPITHNVYNLGDPTHYWSNLYVINLSINTLISPSSLTLGAFGGSASLTGGTIVSLNAGTGIDLTTGGSVAIAAGSSGNIFLFADRSTAAHGASGCLYLSGAIVNPTSNPSTGVFIYVSAGSLVARTPNGITTLAP